MGRMEHLSRRKGADGPPVQKMREEAACKPKAAVAGGYESVLQGRKRMWAEHRESNREHLTQGRRFRAN